MKREENFEPLNYEFSDKFKRKMNRLFREQVGIRDNIPHPEVDNRYERFRSRIVRLILVFADRVQKIFLRKGVNKN